MISCFVTHRRSRPNRFNRLDVFKYTLQSYARVPFSHVYLRVSLDHEFEHRKEELRLHAESMFACTAQEFSLDFARLNNQAELASFIKPLHDRFGGHQLVWFTQNDDHVFIDMNTQTLQEGLALLAAHPAPYKSLYLSHWPEIIRVSGKGGQAERVGNYVRFPCTLVDSIQVFNLQYLYHIAVESAWADPNYTRIDSVFPQTFAAWTKQTLFAPLKEQCRKFDGYDHVHMDSTACSPLHLPPEANVFPTDPDALARKMRAHHQSIWTENNRFEIPDEWILAHLQAHLHA